MPQQFTDMNELDEYPGKLEERVIALVRGYQAGHDRSKIPGGTAQPRYGESFQI